MSKKTVITESEWMRELNKLPKRNRYEDIFTPEMDERILEAGNRGISWRAFGPLFKHWYGFGHRDTLATRYRVLITGKKPQ
jgi:hypothetical protein